MIKCNNCNGKGIWKGLYHSSVCAICGGCGCLSEDGERYSHKEALKILKNARERTLDEISAITKAHGLTNVKLPKIDNPNDLISHKKSAPLHWAPKHFELCSNCRGTGTYIGIVSRSECGQCNGLGFICTSDVDEDLIGEELVAAIAFKNRRLKLLLSMLCCTMEFRETLSEYRLSRKLSQRHQKELLLNSRFD